MATQTPARSEHAPVEHAPPRMVPGWWWLVLAGSLLGIVSTIWQTVERIAWAAGEAGPSFCEISSVVSCTSVYGHWQSSALGVPNSLIGLPVFAIVASGAVSALLGSRPSPAYLRTLFGLTLFMTVFATWYVEQMAFSIGSLCVFCLGCLVFIAVTGMGLTRVVAAEGALGAGRAGRTLTALVGSGGDVAVWVGLGLVVVTMLVVGLGY